MHVYLLVCVYMMCMYAYVWCVHVCANVFVWYVGVHMYSVQTHVYGGQRTTSSVITFLRMSLSGLEFAD